MISDIQFLAQVMIKIRAGDQVTVEETRRLHIMGAGLPYSEPFPGQPASISSPLPEGVTPEQVASATRVGGATFDAN